MTSTRSGCPRPDGEPTGRLTPAQVAELRDTLHAAWPLLSPASAAEIAAIVRVIVPYRAPDSGLVSTSSPQAFGTVAMSRQPDGYTCAETLVHETQHLKLCALLDLVQLTRPDDGQRYYAPWRTDPRPASGLLQGAYAFLGVSGFWREQRRAAPEPGSPPAGPGRVRALARRRRAGGGNPARAAGSSPGRAGIRRGDGRVLDAWRREPVPDDARVVAQHMADRHRAQWQRGQRARLGQEGRLRWRAGRSPGRVACFSRATTASGKSGPWVSS